MVFFSNIEGISKCFLFLLKMIIFDTINQWIKRIIANIKAGYTLNLEWAGCV